MDSSLRFLYGIKNGCHGGSLLKNLFFCLENFRDEFFDQFFKATKYRVASLAFIERQKTENVE